MRPVGSVQFIILLIILFTRCLTVRADYADADKAYEMGNYAFAFYEYMKLAEHGDVRAQVNVGWMYYYGEGVRQDKTQAMSWYRNAAKLGDLTSMFNLAYGYEHGDGVNQSLYESGKWYSNAAAQRNVLERLDFKRLTKQFLIPSSDQTRLLKVLTDQKRIPFTNTAAEAIITPSSAANAEPAHLTSNMREEVRKGDISKSQKQITDTLKSADKTGVLLTATPAQLETKPVNVVKKDNVGNALSSLTKSEVEKFRNPRLEEIRRAAEAGSTDAQVTLGWIYSSGTEIPVDKSKAIKWYRLAAEKGNLNAQIALGWIFYDGQGYERNLKESALWYSKAAAQGNIKAGQKLKQIKRLCEEYQPDIKITSGCPEN